MTYKNNLFYSKLPCVLLIALISTFIFAGCESAQSVDEEPPFVIVQPTTEIDLPIRQLVAGHSFSLILTNSGKVFSWGYNDDCVGERHLEDIHKPILVNILKKVIYIGGNETHCYAITESNELYMWGSNSSGQLGNGSFESNISPVKVEFPNKSTIKKVALGHAHTLALTETGDVYSWGYNEFGQLGDGQFDNRNSPLKIELEEIVDIAAGDLHSLAINKFGDLYTWGNNEAFELGLGDNILQHSPNKVAINSQFIGIEANGTCSFALTDLGEVFSWGSSTLGILGHGDSKQVKYPTMIDSLKNIKRVYSGWLFNFAIDDDGSFYAWGENAHGELGAITEERFISAPIKIDFPEDITSLTCGAAHAYAIGKSGNAYGWGALGALEKELITYFSPEVIKFN